MLFSIFSACAFFVSYSIKQQHGCRRDVRYSIPLQMYYFLPLNEGTGEQNFAVGISRPLHCFTNVCSILLIVSSDTLTEDNGVQHDDDVQHDTMIVFFLSGASIVNNPSEIMIIRSSSVPKSTRPDSVLHENPPKSIINAKICPDKCPTWYREH